MTALATNLPAAPGTNWTSFTHTNGVAYPPAAAGGGGGGSPIPPPLLAATPAGTTASTTASTTAGTVAKKKRLAPPQLPPVPWDPAALSVASGGLAPLLAGNPQPTSGPSATTNATCGFYRVVREGVFLSGVSANQTLTGDVRIGVEIGLYDKQGPMGVSILDTNGLAIPALSFQDVDAGILIADWPTCFAANGTYPLKGVVTFGDTGPYDITESPVVPVQLSNPITFPDPINRAGDYLFIDVQTIHTNGSYSITLYGDPAEYGTGALLTVTGIVSSAGSLIDGGYQGVRFSLLDANKQHIPGAFFIAAITTQAAEGGSITNILTITNTIPVQFPWPKNTAYNATKFTIGFQPVFGSPNNGNPAASALQSLIQLIYLDVGARSGGLGVEPGTWQAPFELVSQGSFSQWASKNLRADAVRNLFYFGHGNPNQMGSQNANLTTALIRTALNNIAPTAATVSTNAHLFRFVFLYGCETASGDLPLAFGIPKKEGMKKADFLIRGLRPQAFVGWKTWKMSGFAGIIDHEHVTFIQKFFSHWKDDVYPVNHQKQGQPIGLKDALDKAAVDAGWTGWFLNPYNDLVIYGADDLNFEDAGDAFP